MITLDASVWVGFLDRNDPFCADSEALLQRLQAAQTAFFSPEFAVLELACAVARRHRAGQAGRAAAALLRRHPRLRLIETLRLLPIAEEVGCASLLRGADALYAATARLTGTPLVTWDRELIERSGGMTPSDWLARNA